mmetsp:Transcript_1401/g.3262  ORF Transcript_1401/g.3262 Transcript_1401/m.3262 type:complete len:309 (+) Transcript_1401:34-960(+)
MLTSVATQAAAPCVASRYGASSRLHHSAARPTSRSSPTSTASTSSTSTSTTTVVVAHVNSRRLRVVTAAAAAAAASPSASDTAKKTTWEGLEREVAQESVGNIMATNITTCKATDSVLTALELLVSKRISAVPVVDDDNKVLGVISEFDLLVRLGRKSSDKVNDGMFPKIGRCDEFGGSVKDMWSRFMDIRDRMDKAQSTTVADAMSDTVTVTSDTLLADATDTMLNEKLHRLCVVDHQGRLLGVLSRGDVIRRTFDAFNRGRAAEEGFAALASGADASDPGVSRSGDNGMEEFCDDDPSAMECKVFD